jgi:hypothetical protein
MGQKDRLRIKNAYGETSQQSFHHGKLSRKGRKIQGRKLHENHSIRTFPTYP